MEEVKTDFEKLSLSDSGTVGVFYHPDCLLHKSTHEHPERPERVASIWERFKQKDLLKRCKTFSDYSQADVKVINDCHGEDYVEYVETMWDENSKREVRFFTDTYYNKHTTKVAKLGVNALLIAVDEIVNQKLKRAFALIRPPGHHAAAKSNRIQGFCIYNNVAVAAKYALTKPGIKKIVIFDWDVHHGDSTSKLFYEDSSVLYISLHRYDEGNFYPQGTFAGLDMVGKGNGEGYNINIPWNLPHPYESIGDDEYVYIMERILMPIIESFAPDMMFISAGFDSGRGDPLGGIDVTPDGFAYMTKRLTDICPGRTIIALEGGYNLQTLSDSAEACLRILLDEKIPLVISENGKTSEEMRNQCSPNKIAQQIGDQAVEILKKYWPKLEDPNLLEFEKQSKSHLKVETDVVAGHPEKIIIKQDKLLKKCKPQEIESYKNIFDAKNNYSSENKVIQTFIPAFLGTFILNESSYLILENYLYKHPNSSIIDIKLGKVTWAPDVSEEKAKREQKKSLQTTSAELGFRISGAIKRNVDTKKIEEGARKQIYYEITKETVQDYLSTFFKSTMSDPFDKEMRKYFIEYMERLFDFFDEKNSRSWIGTSLLFMFNETQNFYKAGWIDIGYCYPLKQGEKDENTMIGLKNLINIFKNFQS